MYAYGRNVAKELISAGKTIKKAYLQDGFKEESIISYLNDNNIEIEYLNKFKLDKMEKGNHQGIILLVDDYKYYDEKDMYENMPENPFIVMLDHLEDPHNFGAIIRTCEASGVDYIIIPKDRSVSVNQTVMKTSVGALNNVKIVQVTNLNNTIKKLKECGVWIVGTDMEDAIYYDEVDYKYPTCLIIGSEGFGISSLARKNCDYIVKIPMFGKVNSLNASVAAAIVIYEAVKQRK